MVQAKQRFLSGIPKELNLGYIVSADDIEKTLNQFGSFSLNGHNISTNTELLQHYIRNEGFSILKINDLSFIDHIIVDDNNIHIPKKFINSYIAADIAGFLRIKHIENDHDFTFETVLSHPSKLNFLKLAKSKGYRIYIYYIATESAEINVNRVQIRVSQHGHPVPEAAIRNRYTKSLNLLYDTIKLSDRAYLFDNSGKESLYIAEITNGEDVELHCSSDQIPNWFIEYVINPSSVNN
jgi:predicted ABC-type ATPase